MENEESKRRSLRQALESLCIGMVVILFILFEKYMKKRSLSEEFDLSLVKQIAWDNVPAMIMFLPVMVYLGQIFRYQDENPGFKKVSLKNLFWGSCVAVVYSIIFYYVVKAWAAFSAAL